MSLFPVNNNPRSQLQSRLFYLATLSVVLLALILTLSPAVKMRSWNVDYRWSHWIAVTIWIAGAAFIHQKSTQQLKEWDAIILPLTFLLIGWGLLTIWRLNIVFGIRQTLWYILSIILAYLFFKFEGVLSTLKRYKYLLLFVGLILAVLTFLFGTYPSGEGPNLWLGFQGLYFQPSELLKIILIIYLAAFFSEKYFLRVNIIETILPTLLLVLAALFILVGQRDMGTALIFIVIYIGMLYITFGQKRILVIGILIIAIAAIVGYLYIDLIRIRFQAWMQPWLDPQSGSYQIIQSIIAIAAGGVFGSGIGIGYPGLVPIPHSDFIYTSIIEESGMVGSIALISMFTILLYRGIQIALKTNNHFYRYLASGITIYMAFQTILIVGGNIRLLPITGVTLPLVSYGGSSLVTTSLAIYFLVKISDCNQDFKHEARELIPFRNGAALFSIGMILLAIVTGWWGIIHSDDLQLRPDNARRLTASRYVQRGSILDRNGVEITSTSGTVGRYEHELLYLPLSNTIGYHDSNFGINALEEEFDDYLSGQRGYPAFDTWFNYLLYDQPLPGRDIRLTLDLSIQQIVDESISDLNSSAVIMNAANGEILAISSFPHYDANALNENWETWLNDPNSPLLNRASQGAYPVGELLLPYLISQDTSILDMEMPEATETDWDCAVDDETPELWSQAITRGCGLALQTAADDLDGAYIANIIAKFGLNTNIDIGLPINLPQALDEEANWQEMLLGEETIRVSPLQMVYAASVFSGEGKQAVPQIHSAVNTQDQGWVITAETDNFQVLSEETARDITRLLSSNEITGWEISAQTEDENGQYAWYLAGTPSNWNSTPIVMVLVAENFSAEELRSIGQQVFERIIES